MRILFLAQRVPFPPNRGDKITTYHEIRHLSRHHEVSVACLADGPNELAHPDALRSMVASIRAVPVDRMRARARALAALASDSPLTLAYFNERALHRHIADQFDDRPFDLILVYSSGMAQFVEKYSNVPRIMQFADLDSLKWQQYSANSAYLMRRVYELESTRLLKYERRIAREFSHSLVCTPREMHDFQRLIPGARVSCVRNGVDLEFYQPSPILKNDKSLIFTGVMNYFPNVEGVKWFCREVLPLIRREVPESSFTICGAEPTAAIRKLERIEGVVVTGRVPDVRPYLAKSAVCVVPLRIARGIQNKLLEAMAMGLPTVATNAAYAGLDAVNGRDLFVADEPTTFALAVVRLLRDSALRTEIGRSARCAVETHYRWDQSLSELDEVIAAVSGDRSEPTRSVVMVETA
jgi:polysaccharide biosynthesis protein PslH